MKFSEQVASKLPKGLVGEDVIIQNIEEVTLNIFRVQGNSKLIAKKKLAYLFRVDQDFLSDVLSEYKSL